MTDSLIPFASFDNDLIATVSTGGYLPYLKLISSQAKEATTDPTSVGKWCLISGSGTPNILDKTLDSVPIAYRAKGVDNRSGSPIYVYENNDHYKELLNLVKNARPNELPPCMAGVEFLLYTANGFCTLYLYNKSGWNILGPLQTNIGKGITLGSKLAETNKNKQVRRWIAPTAEPCAVPPDISSEDEDYVRSVINGFMNPPKTDVTLAQNPADTGRPQ